MQSVMHIGAHLLFAGVSSVNRGAYATHQNHAAFKLLLQGRNVVLRKHALPDLYAYLRHVFDYRHQIRIRVMYRYDTLLTYISIESAVRFLEELPPHLRLHEESVLCTPVIVREDHIRLQVLYEMLHI